MNGPFRNEIVDLLYWQIFGVPKNTSVSNYFIDESLKGGIYFPELDKIIISPNDDGRLVAHEAFHRLFRGRSIPPYLEEGFAELMGFLYSAYTSLPEDLVRGREQDVFDSELFPYLLGGAKELFRNQTYPEQYSAYERSAEFAFKIADNFNYVFSPDNATSARKFGRFVDLAMHFPLYSKDAYCPFPYSQFLES